MSDLEVESVAPNLMRASAIGWSSRLWLVLGLLAVIALGGAGAWIDHKLTPQPIVEDMTQAPQVAQADGSVLAARAPDARPPAPPHAIPKGYREVRRDTVTVAPTPAAAASGCPPVTVTLSTVRRGSDQRVQASSPDGQVVAAIDIPIEAAVLPPAPLPWAAGLSYDTRHAVGVWVDRDIGRLVVGASVARLPDGKSEAQLRVGVRF